MTVVNQVILQLIILRFDGFRDILAIKDAFFFNLIQEFVCPVVISIQLCLSSFLDPGIIVSQAFANCTIVGALVEIAVSVYIAIL